MKDGTSRWFRINLWLHRWTSLIATIPFLILCLTGTVLIFHEEIDHALGEIPAVAPTSGKAQRPLADSVATVQAAYPQERVLSTGLEPEEHPGVLLVVTAPRGETSFAEAKLRFVDLATAQLIGDPNPGQTLTGFLLELHAQWFLGEPGELIGALIALLVLLSLLSGLVVYAPYVKRVAFGVLRRGRGARLLQLDLHNYIGAVVLGWAVVVTITGFLLGFGSAAIGLWQLTEFKPFIKEAEAMVPVDFAKPPIGLDQVFTAVAGIEPGWEAESIIYPGTEFSTPRHYLALLVGTEGLDQRLFRVAAVDAMTGEVVLKREMPAYLKAIQFSQPLHFGDYGGLALKILWTTCTWLTLFITANGAWLWWSRRRRKTGSGAVAA